MIILVHNAAEKSFFDAVVKEGPLVYVPRLREINLTRPVIHTACIL
jgi:hypothetical protein